MENIINIIKYTLKELKNLYFVEVIILLISLFIGHFISIFTVGFEAIPIVSIILTINLVNHMIEFSKQISRSKGGLLFLAPIKGYEFVISKILEFIISQGALVGLYSLGIAIFNSSFSEGSVLILVKILFGMISSYTFIILLILIYSTFLNKTKQVVICVIGTLVVGQWLADSIFEKLFNLIPYIYLRISTVIELNLFKIFIELCVVVALIFYGSLRLDRNKDII